jgi:tRNA(fMet)-specific endonuclease VapC
MIGLDTNAVIAAINQRLPNVRHRVEAALAEGMTVGVPAIVLYELWYGVRKSDRPAANATTLSAFLTLNLALWPFEPEDAEEAGEIRAALEHMGTPIGPYDVLIAAQARRRNAILVTANSREFDRVPGLRMEDWAVA